MISFTKETLREAISGLRVLKLHKQSMSVLQCVLIHGHESIVRFAGTDLDQYLQYEGVGSSTTATRLLVPYEVLVNAAKQADATGEIRLNAEGEACIIYPVAGALIAVPFPSLDVGEFPPKPSPEGDPITLPAGVLGAMNEALGCASTDTTRYILNSVYLDAHVVAATDGRQLYRRNSLELPLTEGAIFPRSGVPSFLPDTEAELLIWTEHSRRLAQIKVGRWRWITKLVEGRFPNFAQVIPRLDDYGAMVHLAESDVARLRSVVPKLPGFKEHNSAVILSLSPDKGAVLKTLPRHPKVHVGLDRSDCVCTAPLEVGFNAKYLLGALETGMRELRVRDAVSPLMLLSESRLQLWMPINLGSVSAQPVAEASPTDTQAASTDDATPSPISDPSSECPTPVVPVSETQPVSETHTNTQTHNPSTTMVAPAHTTTASQPARETREDTAAGVVASRIPPAVSAQPMTVMDAFNARLNRLRDLLRETNTEFANIQALVKEQQRSYRVLERDHEALKKNIRALREVPV